MMPSPPGESGTAEPARKHQINYAYFPYLYKNILTCHTALLSDCISLPSFTPRGEKPSDPPPLPPKPFPFHGRRKKTLSLFLLLLLFGKRAFPGLNGGWRERESGGGLQKVREERASKERRERREEKRFFCYAPPIRNLSSSSSSSSSPCLHAMRKGQTWKGEIR